MIHSLIFLSFIHYSTSIIILLSPSSSIYQPSLIPYAANSYLKRGGHRVSRRRQGEEQAREEREEGEKEEGERTEEGGKAEREGEKEITTTTTTATTVISGGERETDIRYRG